jgi:hydroxymethylglutaryl-CoA reductase (NADPH)
MTGKRGLTQQHAASLLHGASIDDAASRLRPDPSNLPDIPPGSAKISRSRARKLWDKLGVNETLRNVLLDQNPGDLACYQGNIENFIGLAHIPIGLAGPLRVNGIAAKGDYPIPLATTEAALVASYHRGCRLITAAGGCAAVVLYESLSRAPAFVFTTTADACRFVVWAMEQFDILREVAASTTSMAASSISAARSRATTPI